MSNTRGEVPKSTVSRFILGAGIGLAISIPLFSGVDSAPGRIIFMVLFSALMGGGQIIAGRNTEGSRKFVRYALVGGVAAFIVGVVFFLLAS